jgi:G3E family GTPase
LGAGKTTLIGKIVPHLQRRGLRCGLITNDQGQGLVDSVLARQHTESVAEITGGCFCCRLEHLVAAVERLSERERPDVFLAEPVGSCTDLMATVLLPLGQIYRMPLKLAPLSILLDGERAYRTLVSRRRTRDFSKDVGYIYRKQIEEAEIIVINKIDLLTVAQRGKLRERLEREYPGRKIFELSALSEAGIEAWLEAIMAGVSAPHEVMEVDYQRYGVGEALLGWLNATVTIVPHHDFDGATRLHQLAHAVVEGLERERIAIAHFKMILAGADGSSLRVQVTRDGEKPQFAGGLDATTRGGKLLINLRAEGDPERLAAIVREGMTRALKGVPHTMEEFAHFRPGQPKPTHRVAELVA